jgi:hypothetical protein
MIVPIRLGWQKGATVPIASDETLIQGGWELVNGRTVADASLMRIRSLIMIELEKVADTSGGWETLYRDQIDGRLWERFFPQGEMHGGGPESLRTIDAATAEDKYGVRLRPSAK